MTMAADPMAGRDRDARTLRRIAMISAHTSPLATLGGREAGGLNVYVRELSRELGARGYVVDVYTRWASPDAPEVQPIGPNVRVINITAGARDVIDKDAIAAHLDEFERGIAAFAEREGATYDLVHSHYWMSGRPAIALARRWGAPHIAMFHTLAEVKNRARLTEHESLDRIIAERDIARTADRIVVATEHERDLLTSLYDADAGRIVTVPCGVDLDLFTPMDKEIARARLRLSERERIILFVGRIEPLKGIDILINVAAQLHEDENFCVLIVGGDARAEAEVEQLRALAARLGVDHHIAFVGAVEHDDLPLYYNAADVCVVPSYYESFGMVAVEAMACGTPVVASRVGGLASTISDGETGYLIPWRCPEPFAERLELLLDNDELRAAFGRAGREAVERYRWANVAEAVAGLYDSLLPAVAESAAADPL
jgi:D-inositol-3-phosphate glycosyltransferase